MSDTPGVPDMLHPAHRRIVILGGGFAGVYAARELARLLPREEDCDITVIDRNNFFLFTPMVTEVAGGEVDPRDIVTAIRLLSPRVAFIQARVDAVDLDTKTVTYTTGDWASDIPEATATIQADHLVFALGSVPNYHHVPGLAEHSLTIKTAEDAVAVHNRAVALLERANGEPDERTRRVLLTFVVGGGGFSGVETMAALNSFVRESLRFYPNLDEREVRMVLAHHGGRLLPELGERLAHYTERQLRQRGVEVVLQTRVTGAGEDWVELGNGERIPTHMLVWAGGVMPSPLVRQLDCTHGRHGGIATDATFAVAGRPGVWAIGDCAEIPHPGSRETYAPTAQNATREGVRLARNIVALRQGQPVRPFRFSPLGELALIGKRTGVASVFGLQFSGLVAWAMWRAIYLAKEPHMGKRIRIAGSWLLDACFGRNLTDLPSRRTPAAPSARVTGRPETRAPGDAEASDSANTERGPALAGRTG